MMIGVFIFLILPFALTAFLPNGNYDAKEIARVFLMNTEFGRAGGLIILLR